MPVRRRFDAPSTHVLDEKLAYAILRSAGIPPKSGWEIAKEEELEGECASPMSTRVLRYVVPLVLAGPKREIRMTPMPDIEFNILELMKNPSKAKVTDALLHQRETDADILVFPMFGFTNVVPVVGLVTTNPVRVETDANIWKLAYNIDGKYFGAKNSACIFPLSAYFGIKSDYE